ncbi:MAG: acyl-CoA thioester hydrolase [Planctomycetota bacterium]|jgi:acyl-CoA thioester hydrolase
MPKRPEHAIELHSTVAFYQCDPLDVAWHGRYFEWLEEARTELFASRELEVAQIKELGFRMYVVEANCRYMAPLRYREPLRMVAWFSQVEPKIRVAYDIYHGETGQWCARAFTVLATTDYAGKLLPTTPDAILERLPSR